MVFVRFTLNLLCFDYVYLSANTASPEAGPGVVPFMGKSRDAQKLRKLQMEVLPRVNILKTVAAGVATDFLGDSYLVEC
jgi:hypothetical protein